MITDTQHNRFEDRLLEQLKQVVADNPPRVYEPAREEAVFARADGTGSANASFADTESANTESANTVPEIIAKNATPSVTVAGPPAELTLWSMGRVSAAHVELSGPDEAVARLSAWRR